MGHQTLEIIGLLFSRSAEKLYAIESDIPGVQSHRIHVIDVSSRDETSVYWSNLDQITRYTMDANDKYLLLLEDGKVGEYDLSPGSHGLIAYQNFMVGGGPAGSMYVWDLSNDRTYPFVIGPYRWEGCPIRALSTDWTRTVTFCYDQNETLLWDTSTNTILARSTEDITEFSLFSPDNRRLIDTKGDDCELRLWDAETFQPLTGWIENVGDEVGFNRNGRLFAGVDCLSEGDQAFYVWSAEAGEQLATFREDVFNTIYEMAFSPAEDLLVILGLDAERMSKLWYVRGLEGLLDGGTTPPEISVAYQSTKEDPLLFNDLVFSPDGRLLAMSGSHKIKLFDVQTRMFFGLPILANIDMLLSDSSASPSNRIVFSPDMSLMVVADDETQLIDLGNRLPNGPAIPGYPRMAAISPDGTKLAVNTQFWYVGLEAWKEIACQIAGRNLTPEEWSTYIVDFPYRKTCEGYP